MSSTRSLSGRGGMGHWPVDVSSITSADARAVVVLAATVGGWAIVSHHDAPWHLVSEDHTAFQVPTNTGLRASVFRSMVNKVLRHSSPALNGGVLPPVEAIEAMADQVRMPKGTKRTLVSIYTSFVAAFAVPVPMAGYANDLPDPETPPPGPAAPAVEEPVAHPTPPPAPPATKRRQTPVWLSGEVAERRPFLAKANSTGDLYESNTTVELLMVDGHTAFECKAGCGYRNERHISVARHYAAAHSKGESPQPPTIAHDPTIRPFDLSDPEAELRRQARIERLAAELRAAIGDGSMVVAYQGVEALSTQLAMRVIDARIKAKQDHDDNHDAAPLTPEDIINKIAVLVDRGRTVALLAEVEGLRADLEAERVSNAARLGEFAALADMLAQAAGSPAVAS